MFKKSSPIASGRLASTVERKRPPKAAAAEASAQFRDAAPDEDLDMPGRPAPDADQSAFEADAAADAAEINADATSEECTVTPAQTISESAEESRVADEPEPAPIEEPVAEPLYEPGSVNDAQMRAEKVAETSTDDPIEEDEPAPEIPAVKSMQEDVTSAFETSQDEPSSNEAIEEAALPKASMVHVEPEIIEPESRVKKAETTREVIAEALLGTEDDVAPKIEIVTPPPLDMDRRDPEQNNRVLGHVISCDGARATISSTVTKEDMSGDDTWSVGRLISIENPQSRIVGLIYDVGTGGKNWDDLETNTMLVHVELLGEIHDRPSMPKPRFDKGITNYPSLGAIAHRIRANDLAAIYDIGDRQYITVGKLSQDENIAASVGVNEMLTRHFAVLGTTGTGKSSSVSLLMHKIIEARPDLRILIFDPHNEYACAFEQEAAAVDVDNLDLPFWLFNLEELVGVIFRGKRVDEEEVDLLRDLIPAAKIRFRQTGADKAVVLRKDNSGESITADTPIPYRMSDLLKELDNELGDLENKNLRSKLKALRGRIESTINDPRFRFMFTQRTISDTTAATVAQLFRIPSNGRVVTTFQMAGIPSEVVNSVVSVVCRMAFEMTMASQGQMKILIMCEEAHRYIPEDQGLGFEPTRLAIARIAKEGRKYGVYLGIITQRPGELDPTILSQCNTVFALRLSNDRDQEIIRKALADSSASTVTFLSSIGNREAIAFGEALATPMRMRFANIPLEWIPGRHADAESGASEDYENMTGVLERWRETHQPK